MIEGLFQPMHLIVGFFLLTFGLPLVLVCRWLWRKGGHAEK
jgi:hypothetical protein